MDEFVDAVEDVMNGVKRKRNKRKGGVKKVLKGHKRELCEACKMGVHKVGRADVEKMVSAREFIDGESEEDMRL